MAISIRRITCREAWENPAWPQIMKEYGEEVQYPGLEPNPDREMYERLESAGVAQFVGAFDGDRLVGIADGGASLQGSATRLERCAVGRP